MNTMNLLIRGSLTTAHCAVSTLQGLGCTVFAVIIGDGPPQIFIDPPPYSVPLDEVTQRWRTSSDGKRCLVNSALAYGCRIEWVATASAPLPEPSRVH